MSDPSVSLAATVFGGQSIDITYRAPFISGDKTFKPGDIESVFVRELEVDPTLLTFGSLVDKPAEVAEFICERPAGWARTLAKPSLIEVVDRAIDLNFTTARLYLESRARLKRLLGGPTPAASTTSAAASD